MSLAKADIGRVGHGRVNLSQRGCQVDKRWLELLNCERIAKRRRYLLLGCDETSCSECDVKNRKQLIVVSLTEICDEIHVAPTFWLSKLSFPSPNIVQGSGAL